MVNNLIKKLHMPIKFENLEFFKNIIFSKYQTKRKQLANITHIIIDGKKRQSQKKGSGYFASRGKIAIYNFGTGVKIAQMTILPVVPK